MLERPAEIKALFSHSLDPVRSPGSARQDAAGRVAGPQQIVVDLEVLSVEATYHDSGEAWKIQCEGRVVALAHDVDFAPMRFHDGFHNREAQAGVFC